MEKPEDVLRELEGLSAHAACFEMGTALVRQRDEARAELLSSQSRDYMHQLEAENALLREDHGGMQELVAENALLKKERDNSVAAENKLLKENAALRAELHAVRWGAEGLMRVVDAARRVMEESRSGAAYEALREALDALDKDTHE